MKTITCTDWTGSDVEIDKADYIKRWTDSLYNIKNFRCAPNAREELCGHIAEIEKIIEAEAATIFES